MKGMRLPSGSNRTILNLLDNYSQVTKTSILSEYLSEHYSRYMAFPNYEEYSAAALKGGAK